MFLLQTFSEEFPPGLAQALIQVSFLASFCIIVIYCTCNELVSIEMLLLGGSLGPGGGRDFLPTESFCQNLCISSINAFKSAESLQFVCKLFLFKELARKSVKFKKCYQFFTFTLELKPFQNL